jgi:DNA-binding transcriptional LysR family regulator
VVVVAEGHPLADRKAPTIDELVDIEWALREPGSGTRSVFEDAMAQRGIDPARLRIALELPSNEAVRAAVEAGTLFAGRHPPVDRRPRVGLARPWR